jgi:hypothetical protein
MIRPPRDWLKRRSKFGVRVASREMETNQRKPVAMGAKPERSAETRRALATVTPAREVRAEELWREHAPKGAEGLLDAVTTERKA